MTPFEALALQDAPRRKDGRRSTGARFLDFLAAVVVVILSSSVSAGAASPNEGDEVLVVKGQVEVLRAGMNAWTAIGFGEMLLPGDRLRTGARSKASLLLSGGGTHEVPERSEFIRECRGELPVIELLRGMIRFFHRGPPRSIEIRGGGASAAVLGTEFTFEIDLDGTVTLALYDGQVGLTNDIAGIALRSGEIGRAAPRKGPFRETSVWMPTDFTRIQWALYYPAILNLDELGGLEEFDSSLSDSIRAYGAGNLPEALRRYPEGRRPTSPSETIYLVALLLSVGNVQEAEVLLNGLPEDSRAQRLASAHRQLIAAVLGDDRAGLARPSEGSAPNQLVPDTKSRPLPSDTDPDSPTFEMAFTPNLTATECLALSYHYQALARLDAALDAARYATEIQPRFGLAWARRAELELGFGRDHQAAEMAERALSLSPENSEAVCLQGFLHAARNRIEIAQRAFDRAIRLDGGLANAWLGRGLCRIRRGDLAGGRKDLLIAAANEPERSLLRSYLAKGFADSRLFVTPPLGEKARHELDLARQLDPFDPIPWLYQSILDREENRVNDAIRDLDRVQNLTRNRALYRSEPLLDQDRAVASANQAIAYRDAGMIDVAVQAAQRSVATDYANATAHQFLADSYSNAERLDLRYETPRVAEHLIANLLSPVGAGLLSSVLSQQEYSKLFERDGVGGFSQTTYLSRGAWTQYGGALGTLGNSAFLAEGFHQSDPGYVANNDLEQTGFNVQIKQQVGPRDTLYAQTFFTDLDSGDLAFRYDPNQASPNYRYDERTAPVLLAGWHREWSPDHQTVLLAGWVENEMAYSDAEQLLSLNGHPTMRQSQYQTSDFDLFTSELQHLWTPENHSVVLGARWQRGDFEAVHQESLLPLNLLIDSQQVQSDFEHLQLYAYDSWRALESLHFTAGISYDDLLYPLNHRYGLLDDREDRRNQISPKIGAIWELLPKTRLRAAYTRSLGGVTFDQSFRLEPTQVAGFNQAFRSLVPESVTGPSSAPGFDTVGVALETRPLTNTWVSVSGEFLSSEVTRWWGDPGNTIRPATQNPQELNYRERALLVTVNQLLGGGWSLGARYRLGESDLSNSDASINVLSSSVAEERALLHHLAFSAYFNHPSGFFAATEAVWFHQDDTGAYLNSAREEFHLRRREDHWQFNIWGGWRFFRRRAELLVGILNLTHQDFRLAPLGLTVGPERERTFLARLSFAF